MPNGAAVEITPTLTGVTGPLTWSVTPRASIGDTLYTRPDNPIAAYSAPADLTADKVTITASAGGISNSIQLNVKPSPVPAPWVTLPVTWTVTFGDPPFLTGARPVDSAADESGNLYLAYSAPVSEIKKVAADGSITTHARVGEPISLAFGPDRVLYVVDRLGGSAYAIRRIAADGTTTTLTQTAPYDAATGTIDGPSRVATAYTLSLAVAPSGAVYASDGSRVRKIAPDGAFSTFAGGGCEAGIPPGSACAGGRTPVDGLGTQARFMGPDDIVTDKAGNLYVSDTALIRKITPAGEVTTLAGRTSRNFDFLDDVDGTSKAASFGGNSPMAIDAGGNLYKLGSRGQLRKITPSGVASTVATSLGFTGAQPQNGIVSLYAGTPGVVVLQSYAQLSKIRVD
ncbi:hypothetical protein SAMN05216204_11238 [Massilia yuzhufengensis]|uniref:NHL repeat-containing protein n=2 Tax=Massilia yuzhufengensis TaxID=1164594 RepID=A0A1I1N1S4_9BURK|nr:hypothetical protein SAMN05216204_11238 [Massilia yuzhufengensis]